jgi:hypothetical protein
VGKRGHGVAADVADGALGHGGIVRRAASEGVLDLASMMLDNSSPR